MPPSPRSPARALLELAVALLAFAAVATVGRRETPWPLDYGLAQKLLYYERRADEYDGIFLGSSLTFRSYVPAIVDTRLAEAGLPDQRSFNLGVPGMRDFEVDYVLRRILALENSRLEWIVLEPPKWDPALDRRLIHTQRNQHWHDWRTTWAALRASFTADAPWLERYELAVIHLRLFLARLTAVGSGPRIFEMERPVSKNPDPLRPWLRNRQGYQPLESLIAPEFRERRRQFVEDPHEYKQRVRELDTSPADADTLARYPLALLEEQLAAAEAAGVRLIYALPPALGVAPEAMTLGAEGRIDYLGYNRPDLYPQLYAVPWRFDPAHPTSRAAERFSLLVGTELGELLAEEE